MLHLVAIPVSNASFNPARSIDPAIWALEFNPDLRAQRAALEAARGSWIVMGLDPQGAAFVDVGTDAINGPQHLPRVAGDGDARRPLDIVIVNQVIVLVARQQADRVHHPPLAGHERGAQNCRR